MTPLSHRRRSRLGIALVAVAATTAVFLAQAPTVGGHNFSSAAPAGAPAAIAAERQQMMKMMAVDDQKLAGLLTTMNAAKGDQKVAAIAAVVNELAAQRTRMQAQMMRMQGGMMDQMMSHMAAMHGPGGMMNKKAPEPAPGVSDQDHAAHHPEK